MIAKVQYLYLGLLFLTWMACVNAPDFPDTPEIAFAGASKLSMVQNSLNTDSIFIRFTFTDGDGDLGSDSRNIAQNVFITDKRTGESYDRYRIPMIPEQGAANGISGEVTIRLYTTCCLFPDNIPPCEAPPQYPIDTLTLDIQIADRAGNMSNTITSDIIILQCD